MLNHFKKLLDKCVKPSIQKKLIKRFRIFMEIFHIVQWVLFIAVVLATILSGGNLWPLLWSILTTP